MLNFISRGVQGQHFSSHIVFEKFSHRARFDVLLGSILFLSTTFLYPVAPTHHTTHHQHKLTASLFLGLLFQPTYGTLKSRLVYEDSFYQGALKTEMASAFHKRRQEDNTEACSKVPLGRRAPRRV